MLYRPRTTPQNAITFANTGGDDVHFSLVSSRDGFGDASPVVMTVPMGGDNVMDINIIVGENLHDFLSLGCRHGFFELEQLVYDRDSTVEMLSQPRQDIDDEDKALLDRFQNELGLTPWRDIGTRLQQLEKQYKSKLKFRNSWLSWLPWTR